MAEARSSWGFSAVVLVLGLSGCGSSAAPLPTPLAPATSAPLAAIANPGTQTRPKPKPRKATKVTAEPAAAPATKTASQPGKASPVPSTPSAEALLTGVLVKVQGMATYKATVSIYDMRKDQSKSGQRKLAITYKAPGQHRIDILQTNNAIQNGMKLAFTVGQNAAKIRGGGLLGVVGMTLPLTDEKLTMQNGWRLDQVVASGIVGRLTTGYTVSVAGTTKVGADTVTVLKLVNPANQLDADIAYELLGFDSANMLRLWACYAKPELKLPNDLMYQMSLDQVSVGINVAADTFDF